MTIKKGIAMVHIPRKVPRRDSVTGLRLCSGILTEGDFALVYAGRGRGDDDGHGGETDKAKNCQGNVGAREDGPGFHVS